MAFAASPAIADLFEVSFLPAVVDIVKVVQLVLGDLVKVEFQPALGDLLEVEFQPALGDVVEVEFGLRPENVTFLGSALFGGPLKTALVAWNVVVDLLEATLDSPPKVLEIALLSS
jgi:hypothetical protein